MSLIPQTLSANNPDFLVIGAGIVGLTIAREILKRDSSAKIVIIEKEQTLGAHASGRNSGVLHAGFYYSKDSYKARFSRIGNERLTNYCIENNLPINQCGKIVVARTEEEALRLDELMKRAKVNGVELQWVDRKQAVELEPNIDFFGDRALFSPKTSSVSPGAILERLQKELEAAGANLHFNEIFKSWNPQSKILTTSKNRYSPGYVINCAGSYADKVANQFGLCKNHTMIPFKGIYLMSDLNVPQLKRHIYPVPDLKLPFLGVHFTITADNKTKIGPTAIPGFWRENYKGLTGFKFSELAETSFHLSKMLSGHDPLYRRLAYSEFQKMTQTGLRQQAKWMVKGLNLDSFKTWGRPGIRAQLVNKRNNQLIMDFLVEQNSLSTHILNAVSPALTCSMAFAEHVVDNNIFSQQHPS